MNFTNNKRKLLFFGLCIPIRLIIAILPLYISNNKWYRFFLVYLGLSFLYLYLSNERLDAIEGGGITWWKDLRIIHGILYLLAAFYLINNNKLSNILLISDIIVGLIGYYFLRIN